MTGARTWLAPVATGFVAISLLSACGSSGGKDVAAQTSAPVVTGVPSGSGTAPVPSSTPGSEAAAPSTAPASSAPAGSTGTSAPASAPATHGAAKKPTPVNTAAEIAAIKKNWEKFFSHNTSVAEKIKLLQNGPQMKGTVDKFASNPMEKLVTAHVTSVTLQSATTATVHYQMWVNKADMLPNATGTSVKQNGVWKVSDSTLCGLLALIPGSGSIPNC